MRSLRTYRPALEPLDVRTVPTVIGPLFHFGPPLVGAVDGEPPRVGAPHGNPHRVGANAPNQELVGLYFGNWSEIKPSYISFTEFDAPLQLGGNYPTAEFVGGSTPTSGGPGILSFRSEDPARPGDFDIVITRYSTLSRQRTSPNTIGLPYKYIGSGTGVYGNLAMGARLFVTLDGKSTGGTFQLLFHRDF